ncbi:MAG: MCE family protein [Clostridia bacterium]|nr:MCE family protein [Clostridia bacterium]
MTDNSKFKLGLFIIIAVIVFFAGLMILGSFEQFKEKAYVTTLVSESVQGLSVGSSVKYMGVPIGSVREISIYPSGNVIRIDMEIKLGAFRTKADADENTVTVEEFQDRIAKAVDRGLRCRMELEGITGSKYVEFNFDPEAPAPTIDATQYALDNTYVPSLPSLISDLRGSVTGILAKLESIDYKGISDRANDTLDTLNARLSSPKFDETLDNVNSMIASAKKSIDNLEKLTDADVRGQIESLTENAKVAVAAGESLAKTLEQEI